jgi:hypothetical protein
MADAFSLIQFKDLPTFTGTLSENATLVAVLDNARTVRIDWDILNSGLIRGSADQPSSPSDLGDQGNLYVGSTGLYSYADGSWGKAPRYTENWDDLVPGVRFLRVDGSQALSSEEKSQALENVGLTIASAGGAGLVKAWGNPSALTDVAPVIINTDGTQYVSKATETSLGVVKLTDVATHDYVSDAIDTAIAAIEDLPIASAEVAGVVLSDTPLEDGGDGVFSVGEDGKVTIRPASLYIYDETKGVNKGGLPGIYSVTAIDDDQALSYAPTLGLVKTLVESAGGLNSVPVATTASVGGVKAWSDNSSYSATDAAKVIIEPSGRQFVPIATSGISGAVRVVTTVDDVTGTAEVASSFTVPTVGAVYSFVSNNFPKLGLDGKVSDSALPLATGSTVGVIKGSSTINIDNEGTASVPDAAVNSKGVVALATMTSGEFVENSGVTTAYQVKTYVDSKLTASVLSGLYVSKADYEGTNESIVQLSEEQVALAADVEELTNDVSALQQSKSIEVLLETSSTAITNVTGWVRYTGSVNSTVTFPGVAPTGYAATLTFQTEVPVTFGGTILWDKGETPSMLTGKGYVFQLTSFPGSDVKLGRKVMEYTPQSNA